MGRKLRACFLIVLPTSFISMATIIIINTINQPPLNETHIYVHDLYVPSLAVPALNKTTTFNTSVLVNLKFSRAVALTQNRYNHDIQMTLSYRNTNFPVGTHTVKDFDMGRKRKVHVKAVVEAEKMPWQEAFRMVSGGKEVAMVVELMRRPFSPYLSPWVAHVAVDASGHMVSKKPIEFE